MQNNTRYMKKINYKSLINRSSLSKKLFLALLLGLFSTSSFAQLVPRPTMTFNGQYDIKMIAAPVLQPVWVKTLNPLQILRPITDPEMLLCGKYLSLNNEVSADASEGGNAVKLTAKMSSKAQPFVPVGAIGIATVYADCDDDMSTFQSSAAYLDFGSDMSCTKVEAAYLYWFAPNMTDKCTYAPYPGIPTMRSNAGGTTGDVTTNMDKVKFKAAGDLTYTDVTASRTINTAGMYVYFADVSSLVKGKQGGLYWVANVRNSGYDDGGGSKGGWNLVVIFKPPNCPPRVIKFWDGYLGGAGGSSITMNFASGEVPKSGNSVSYLGFTTIDAETNAGIVADGGTPSTVINSGLQFLSSPGGTTQYINPFVSDQPGVSAYDQNGVLVTNVQDGMASGRISTYDPSTDKNGNEIIRLPSTINTLGFGCNHLKLPANSMVPNATSAKMNLPPDVMGDYETYMAYMAIETLQPDLRMRLSSANASTAPSGTMTYELSIKNIGSLASKVGAYVLDTLIKSIDFVPGSVQFLRASSPGTVGAPLVAFTPPSPFEIHNQSADINEYLKFYLPIIAAGNGTIANDSVVIRFDVQLQPLTRTDIWSYGCNRTVYNRATMHFLADDGSDLVAGSNSSAGCSGQGSYYSTPIIDATLDAQYQTSHNVSATLTSQVDVAESGGTHLYIIPTVQNYLTQQLTSLKLPVSDVPKYVIYNELGAVVSASDYFTQVEPTQKYTATADLGDGCIETFNFTFLVAKVPKFNIDALTGIIQPDYAGDASGGFNLKAYGGDPGYSLKVTDKVTGTIVFYSNSTTALSLDPAGYTFNVRGLKAGDYDFSLGDQGTIAATGSVTIPDAPVLSVSLGSDIQQCTNSTVTLTATASGRTSGLSYIWTKSTDGGLTWSTALAGATTSANTLSSTYSALVDVTADYKVYVCDGYTQSTDVVNVQAMPLPLVKVAPQDTTVSITINPTVTYTANVTSGTSPFNYNWQVSTDNGSTWNAISSEPLGTYSGLTSSALSVTDINTPADKAMSGYLYKASVVDGFGCTGIEAVPGDADGKLTVVEGPAVTVDPTKNITSCSDKQDGILDFSISAGEPGQQYNINVYAGSGYSDANPPLSAAIGTLSPDYKGGGVPPTRSLTVPSLSAGSYTMVLKPIGGLPGLKNYYPVYTVTSPPPVTVSFTPPTDVCSGKLLTATAIINGGPAGGIKSYSWESSLDGVIFTPTGEVSPTLREKLDVTTYFRVIGNVNTCADTSSTVQVNALPTPKISMLASDSGCYEYDLHTLQVTETSGLTDYVLTLHSAMPSSPTDNRFLIPESKYLLNIKDNKKTKIYARMTVGGLCDSVASGEVYIKEMEECYPIVVMPFFSPDGDGINDRLTISGIDQYRNPEIIIYDRYGKVVFKGGKEAMMESAGWDGTYLGKPLPSGDYWYTINFTEIKPKVGHFALKRKKE